MFKIKDSLVIRIEGKQIAGSLIGIDSYTLENFEGKKIAWSSYTLVSQNSGIFSRYWITDWKKDGWILWTTSKKIKQLEKTVMVLARSGLAKIEFDGDQGVSTPFAALAMYKIKKDSYHAVERFSESQVMCFAGRKILKPKIIKQV